MAIVEIAWFKSTKAYQDDHSLLNEAARRLKQFAGLNKYVLWLGYPIQLLKGVLCVFRVYFGWQVEPEPTIAYVLNRELLW